MWGYPDSYSVGKSENSTCDDSKCLSNLVGSGGGLYILEEAEVARARAFLLAAQPQ